MGLLGVTGVCMLQVWRDRTRGGALQQGIGAQLLQLREVGSPSQGVHHRGHRLAPPPILLLFLHPCSPSSSYCSRGLSVNLAAANQNRQRKARLPETNFLLKPVYVAKPPLTTWGQRSTRTFMCLVVLLTVLTVCCNPLCHWLEWPMDNGDRICLFWHHVLTDVT